MNIKQHFRMTASEIAMGRYMRAPDHDATAGQAEFDAAFSAESLKDAAEDKPADAPPADAPPADAPPADAPPADAPPADAPPADAPPADAPPADAPPADAPPAAETPPAEAPNADAILNQLADAMSKRAGPAAETPPAETPPAEAPALFNETETAALAKFREDWPEEAKAVDLMQRELGRGVIQYVFDQIAPEVKLLRDTVQKLALRAHHSDLDEAIGEYPSDEEIDSIKAWVLTQPTYLQAPMNGVIEKGTAEEISDLVGRYRGAKGLTAGAPAAAEPPGAEIELSGVVKQAATALAPVDSKRTAVQSPEDASDFDAGWARWVDQPV